MRIIGLTRVRNEEHIIQDTLDHMAEFCDEVFVYDDCSEDNTFKICKKHPIVTNIVMGTEWMHNRAEEEYKNRQELLNLGRLFAQPDDWFVYMDADERIEFDFSKLEEYPDNVIGVRMKLFDFYITPEDVDKSYTERKYMGKEFREILFAFKNSPELKYGNLDQREVTLPRKGKVVNDGFVKHYGKAISVEEWEKTCEYYATHFPRYSKKWNNRRGKAIHTESDFGTELITWGQKEEKGMPL